ncbi:GNAT family N-acetyltransferase [Pseudoalteromonas sp. T1lg23B]|uniref:GNAT family N-acetyltransferase n=1 Tax=Pseudoalteromonas sp. T1lg23B TaxID=2077097 RepID=UPI000CF6514A|nr:GNAT family N-acetyltransferase [Pseudoalteromonas sp. T1lg23B]
MAISNVNGEVKSSRLILTLARPQYDEHPDAVAQKIQQVLQPQTCVALPQSWQNINTLADAHRWLRTQLLEAQIYMVVHRTTSELLGVAVVHEQGEEAYIGYVIAKEHWGKGYASEALQTLVACYKEQATVKTLWAGVSKDNISSIKVLTKSGFELANSEHQDLDTRHYVLSLEN